MKDMFICLDCANDVCPALGLLQQKCCVQLDWVSTEDGSHILCVGVGNEITLYAPVSSEIATANMRAVQVFGHYVL